MELILIPEDYWVGHINEVKETIKRSVQSFINHHKKVKVGITNNPQRRKDRHKYDPIGWDIMHVRYHTTSLRYVRELEKIIVDHHWDYLENRIGGGGGNFGEGPYYLYILIKRH